MSRCKPPCSVEMTKYRDEQRQPKITQRGMDKKERAHTLYLKYKIYIPQYRGIQVYYIHHEP